MSGKVDDDKLKSLIYVGRHHAGLILKSWGFPDRYSLSSAQAIVGLYRLVGAARLVSCAAYIVC